MSANNFNKRRLTNFSFGKFKFGLLFAWSLVFIITIEISSSLNIPKFIQRISGGSIKGSFLLKPVDPNSIAYKVLEQYKIDSMKNESKRHLSSQSNQHTRTEEISKDLIKRHTESMGPNLSLFYKNEGGLLVEKGSGCYMIDPDGNHYLDCCNNVVAVGHAHPYITQVMTSALQSGGVQINSRFLHTARYRYIQKLLATFPSELNTVYLVNSGSEANDLALRIARAYTTRSQSPVPVNRSRDVIVLDSAYHGHTQALVEISPYKWYQATDGRNYRPISIEDGGTDSHTTHVVSCPDTYRGVHRGFTESSGLAYAKEVESVISDTGGVGAFIAESIVGCGGQILLPPSYLKQCYEAVRSKGGVCIADEVQTGFARAGTHFWQFQEYGVVPDIVTMGKPMGNGFPMAAVVCQKHVADAFASTGIEYFNTYGGNPLACVVGEAVLDTIHNEQLQHNAFKVGEYLKRKLEPLTHKYKWVGDIRGQGLFQGIEFVKNNHHQDKRGNSDDVHMLLEPCPEVAKFVVDGLKLHRIIVSRDGPDENVIKIKPPLCFNETHVDQLAQGIEDILSLACKYEVFS